MSSADPLLDGPFTLKVPRPWTREQVDDIVLGSGASQYSWYRQLRATPTGYLVEMDDPNTPGASLSLAFTPGQFAFQCQWLLDNPQHAQLEHGQLVSDDLDADGVDRILQRILLGTVEYC